MLTQRFAMSGEHSLIARYFRPLATDAGALGLIDDAAYLRCDDNDLVVTTDAIVEGVHFLPDDPPAGIARKALRVNLSDLAAKGAVPAGFLLTLALRTVDADWLTPFAGALGEDAASFACPLLGGDTVSTPGPLMISITAFGRVAKGRMVRRDGARVGDTVMVTGSIGDAALGLDVLTRGVEAGDEAARNYLVGRYREPRPRSALAIAVRDHASAAMDVSDGLAGDLAKLCAASGVSAIIEATRVPLSAPARGIVEAGRAPLDRLLTGGDDYEILFTIAENQREGFMRMAEQAGIAATAIGTIVQGSVAPRFVDDRGQPMTLSSTAYSHF
jgi:thiamine-monophosphate kinase